MITLHEDATVVRVDIASPRRCRLADLLDAGDEGAHHEDDEAHLGGKLQQDTSIVSSDTQQTPCHISAACREIVCSRCGRA